MSSNLKQDERLAARFENTDSAHLEASLTAFLCKTVGDDCAYQGKDMPAAHAGLQITDDEFDAFMEVFVLSMNDADLPQQEQNDLIDEMMAMRPQVTEK
jgi:hemoglobin